MDAVKEALVINYKARKEYRAILKDLGAKSSYYQSDDRLVGLIFDNEPDRYLYKKTRSGWYPKKNSKAAKAIAKRIEDVKTSCVNECLKVVGLSQHPSIFMGGRCYFPSLVVLPYGIPMIFVSVPWYDEDPEKLEEYKKNENHLDTNYNSLLWEPTPDMVEVKKWMVDKEIDEWNERVMAKKAA